MLSFSKLHTLEVNILVVEQELRNLDQITMLLFLIRSNDRYNFKVVIHCESLTG